MRSIFGPTENHMTLCMRDVVKRLVNQPITALSDAEIDRVIREASDAIRRETHRA
jgi:hypothetical protein